MKYCLSGTGFQSCDTVEFVLLQRIYFMFFLETIACMVVIILHIHYWVNLINIIVTMCYPYFTFQLLIQLLNYSNKANIFHSFLTSLVLDVWKVVKGFDILVYFGIFKKYVNYVDSLICNNGRYINVGENQK